MSKSIARKLRNKPEEVLAVTDNFGRIVSAILLAMILASTGGSVFAAGGGAGEPDGSLTPPPIPATGAYLGAWVNPEGLPSNDGKSEIDQLPRFNSYMAGTVRVLHVFVQFTDPFPADTLARIEANGSIPMIDWHCVNVGQINAGEWDATITSYAQAMRRFAKPAFLRWYWEMNLNTPGHMSCGAFNHGPDFIAAWQRIRTIFRQAGASNVAFVWCPISHGPNLKYYPGDSYVDWVGADAFDRTQEGAVAFQQAFGQFYRQWAARKPMMVGATGASGIDQTQYIRGIQQMLPSLYPLIKAVVYFHAPGDSDNWSLTGNGIAAFRTLAHMPYFTVH